MISKMKLVKKRKSSELRPGSGSIGISLKQGATNYVLFSKSIAMNA
jgi:hypothetical protein